MNLFEKIKRALKQLYKQKSKKPYFWREGLHYKFLCWLFWPFGVAEVCFEVQSGGRGLMSLVLLHSSFGVGSLRCKSPG